MLTEIEQKLVIDTLAKRLAWLEKASADDSLEKAEQEEHKQSFMALASAVKKLKQQPGDESVSAANSKYKDLKTLVIEDDQYSCELLQEMLSNMGIAQIDTAADGSEGLKQMFLADEPYDLVLCDWNMPGKTGLEVHGTMRTDKRFSKVIFMLVSAVSSADQIRAAIGQGVNDYIVKPLDADILQRKIDKAYEKRKK